MDIFCKIEKCSTFSSFHTLDLLRQSYYYGMIISSHHHYSIIMVLKKKKEQAQNGVICCPHFQGKLKLNYSFNVSLACDLSQSTWNLLISTSEAICVIKPCTSLPPTKEMPWPETILSLHLLINALLHLAAYKNLPFYTRTQASLFLLGGMGPNSWIA